MIRISPGRSGSEKILAVNHNSKNKTRPKFKGLIIVLDLPFQNHELFQNIEKNLNLESYLSRTLNDKIYIKLLRERLLKIREKRNSLKTKRYLSYPVGSVILVRDNRPKVNKKLKPIYFKLPQKVINEYTYTIHFIIKGMGDVVCNM